jgi:hypothetical protein
MRIRDRLVDGRTRDRTAQAIARIAQPVAGSSRRAAASYSPSRPVGVLDDHLTSRSVGSRKSAKKPGFSPDFS